MKILKNYAMALVALFIAATSVTLMSFETNKTSKFDEVIWFQVNASGDISPSSTPANTLDLNSCEQSTPTSEPCAVGFLESEMGTSTNAPLDHISDIPSSSLQISYRQKED